MEVRLYADESEDKDGVVHAIGGFIGMADEWERLEEEWVARVRPTGVSAYHMADCDSMQGEFSQKNGWSKADCTQLTVDLIDVICRHEVFMIGTGVLLADYNRIPPVTSDPRVRLGGSEWHLCFGQVTHEACMRLGEEVPSDWTISCFFDWKEKKGLAESLYAQTQTDERLKSWRKRLGPLTFGHKEFDVPESVPLLQVADIAAVETRKRIGNPITRPELAIRKSYQKLVSTGHVWATKVFTFPVLDAMFQMKMEDMGLPNDAEAATARMKAATRARLRKQ